MNIKNKVNIINFTLNLKNVLNSIDKILYFCKNLNIINYRLISSIITTLNKLYISFNTRKDPNKDCSKTYKDLANLYKNIINECYSSFYLTYKEFKTKVSHI